MSSDQLISHAKSLADCLEKNTKFYLDLKHGHALEFISKHLYGYESWNHLCGSDDRPLLNSYLDVMHQSIAYSELIDLAPGPDVFDPVPWPSELRRFSR